jgi:energy-coupling factor transporter ATP-binding protein EcfA2
MRIYWVYGGHNISFNKPYTWMCLGVRGAGKSSLLEHLAELYLSEGNVVLDLFAARSGESLGWLRSKYAIEKKILILTAENCLTSVPYADTKPATKLELSDFEKYDIIINSCIFYPNIDAEFEAVNQIIDLLWRRRRWNKIVYTLVREAANLLYARMKIAETQSLAKSFMAYWLRESRHSGCSLALDSQRFMAIDIDIRSLCDFLCLKTLGAGGLPRDMWFVYRYIKPNWLQYAKPKQFAIISRRGDVGIGIFPLPEWHVKEGEDIASKLGIHVAFEEAPEKPLDRGRYKTVGDAEHSIIIAAYIEEPYGMVKLAKKFNRSASTINNVIIEHNNNVEKIGYCPACRRAKSNYAGKLAKKE